MILHDKILARQVQPVKLFDKNTVPDAVPKEITSLKLSPSDDPLPEPEVYLKAPSAHSSHTKSKRSIRKELVKKEKKWRPKKLPTEWKKLTQSPNWNNLKKQDKRFLMVAWPNRHFRLSYAEVSELWKLKERQTLYTFKDWREKDFIVAEHRFLKRRGKEMPIHERNYYILGERGHEHLKKLLEFLFPVSPKNAERKGLTSLRALCQGEKASPNPAFSAAEEKNQVVLNPEIATIFEMYNAAHNLPKMGKWLIEEINAMPEKEAKKKIVKMLNWMIKKWKKAWKIRNFWGVFVDLWRQKKMPKSWMKKQVDEYSNAIKGKRTMDGVDSQAVVEQILELQKKTGLEATERDLRGLLSYGAIHLSSCLKVLDFKSNAKPIENWISYTHFLAKQPAHELGKMYQPKARPKDETTLEWTKRYLRNHKKNLTFLSSEENINRNVKQVTTSPGVLLQMHAEEDKSVLKVFQKVQNKWIDRTFPLCRPDFKEAVVNHFDQGFKEQRISNAKFFANRARKKKLHSPKETLEWCKSFLGTIKDKVRFLSPGKFVIRDIEAKQTAPIIDLKIHKEAAEKSVLKIHQKVNGEWLDKVYRFDHPGLQKELEGHFKKALSV